MNIRHFTYTKANGDTSNRTVMMLSEPHDNYFAIDLSNLSDDDLTEEDVEVLQEGLRELDKERQLLISNLGFGKRYRNFKPEGISWRES